MTLLRQIASKLRRFLLLVCALLQVDLESMTLSLGGHTLESGRWLNDGGGGGAAVERHSRNGGCFLVLPGNNDQ